MGPLFRAKAGKNASGAPHPYAKPVQRVGVFAGSDREYRSVQSLQKALEAEAPEHLREYVQALADARIDGRAAALLTGEDMQALLPSTPLGDRLSLLSIARSLAMEPAPAIPEENLGERLVAYIAAGGKDSMVAALESLTVTCGLLVTVSASALLTPQCSLGTSPEDSIECTTLQAADAILWTVSFGGQLLAVVLAFYNFGIMQVLHDDNLFKTWLLLNWRKFTLTTVVAIFSITVFMPVAVTLRAWLMVPPPVAGVITGIMTFCLFIVPNMWWRPASHCAIKLLPLGPSFDRSNTQLVDALHQTWCGMPGGLPLKFSQRLSELYSVRA